MAEITISILVEQSNFQQNGNTLINTGVST
jgi:hypothetical protein